MAEPITAAFAAFASAAASATVAVTGSAALAATIGNAILSVGAFLTSWQGALTVASLVGSVLLAPNVNAEGSPTEWRPEPEAGNPFILGRAGFSGRIIHMDEHGDENRYLTVASVLSDGGGAGIESFAADQAPVTFSNSQATAPEAYAAKMWQTATEGDRDQSVAIGLTALAGNIPGLEGWDATSILAGRAHALTTYYQDSKGKSYRTGVPRPLWVLLSIPVYDPRKDSTFPGGSGSHRIDDPSTWEPSKNPGVHGLNYSLGYWRDGRLVGGIGASPAGVDFPAFIELANVSDMNGWEVSAVVTSRDDKHQQLLGILQAGGARYAEIGGKISCIARTPRTPVTTVRGTDTAGPFRVEVNADALVKKNVIKPRCVHEGQNWEMAPQPEVRVQALVDEDGGEIIAPLDLPFVAVDENSANKDQPAQLAAYALLDTRESIAGTVPLKPYMSAIEPGDTFVIDEPGFLLDGVTLLCLHRTVDVVNGIVNVTFISESDGKHDFALGLTNVPPTPPALSVPDIYTVRPPAVGVWGAQALTGAQPGIAVAGDADNPAARGFVIEYRTHIDPATGEPWDGSDSAWVQYGAEFDIATQRIDITGLEPNTTYEVAIRYVSQYGIIGDRLVPPILVTTGGLDATHVSGLSRPDIEGLISAGDNLLSQAIADLGDALDQAELSLGDAIIAVDQRVDQTEVSLGEAILAVDSKASTASDRALESLRALQGRLIGLGAAVVNETEESRSALQNQIERIDAIFTQIEDPETGLAVANAAIIEQQKALAGVREAVIEDLRLLRAQQATASGYVLNEIEARIAANELILTRLDVVEGALGDPNNPAPGTVQARLLELVDFDLTSGSLFAQSMTDLLGRLFALDDPATGAVADVEDRVQVAEGRLTDIVSLNLASGEALLDTLTEQSSRLSALDDPATGSVPALQAEFDPDGRVWLAESAIIAQATTVAGLTSTAAEELRRITATLVGLRGQVLNEVGVRAEQGELFLDRFNLIEGVLGDPSNPNNAAPGSVLARLADIVDFDLSSGSLFAQNVTDLLGRLFALDDGATGAVPALEAGLQGVENEFAPAGRMTLAEGRLTDIINLNLTPGEALFDAITEQASRLLVLDDPATGRVPALEGDVAGIQDEFAEDGRVWLAEAAIIAQSKTLANTTGSVAEELRRLSALFVGVRGQVANEVELRTGQNELSAQRLGTIEGALGDPSNPASGSVLAQLAELVSFDLTTGSLFAQSMDQLLGRVLALDEAGTGRMDLAEGQIDSIINLTLAPGEVLATTLNNLSGRLQALDEAGGVIEQIQGDITGIKTLTLGNGTAFGQWYEAVSTELDSQTANSIAALVEAMATAFVDENGAVSTYLRQVLAGGAFAGMEMVAVDQNGQVTADLRFAAKIFAFGLDFNTPRFVIDVVNGFVYGLASDGVTRTFELDLSNGRLKLRRADGTLIFDSEDGGVQPAGIKPGTAGGKRRLKADDFVFCAWNPNLTPATETSSDFNHFDQTSASIPVLPGTEVVIDLRYRFKTIKNACTLLTLRQRVILESVEGNGVVEGDWSDIRVAPAGNTGGQNEHGDGVMSFYGFAELDFTIPLIPDTDWPAGSSVRARVQIETWNSGRGDDRVLFRSGGANLISPNNTDLASVRAVIETTPSGLYDIS